MSERGLCGRIVHLVLQIAALLGNTPMVTIELLLYVGADFCLCGFNGYTCFSGAARG